MNFESDLPPTMRNSTPSVGELGEQLVAELLQAQNWVILHHRWRCRWGEIDLIARSQSPRYVTTSLTSSPVLAFIEVKTRSPRNWDADGLLAITPQKQAKLWQAAQLFLSQSPALANFPCQFDVALVKCQRVSQLSNSERTNILSPSPTAIGKAIPTSSIQLGQPLFRAGYRLILQDYIQSAFD